MAYKEKTCPKCGTKHTKRGEFCSRSCGNTRKHTEEAKQKISTTQAVRHASGDEVAEEQRYALDVSRDRAFEPVRPPVRAPLSDNQFVQDGDLWSEV